MEGWKKRPGEKVFWVKKSLPKAAGARPDQETDGLHSRSWGNERDQRGGEQNPSGKG